MWKRTRFAVLVFALGAFAMTATAQDTGRGTIKIRWDPLDPAANPNLDGYVVYVGPATGAGSCSGASAKSCWQDSDCAGEGDTETCDDPVPGVAYDRQLPFSDTIANITGLDTCVDRFLSVKAKNDDGVQSLNFSMEIQGWARPIVDRMQCAIAGDITAVPSSTITGPGVFACTVAGDSFDDGTTLELVPDDGAAPGGIVFADVVRTDCQNLTATLTLPSFEEADTFAVRAISSKRIFGGTGAGGFTVTASATVTPPGDVEGFERDDVVVLTVETSQAVVDYLDQLVATGLYGDSQGEAADRLIRQGVERTVRDGLVDLVDPEKSVPPDVVRLEGVDVDIEKKLLREDRLP